MDDEGFGIYAIGYFITWVIVFIGTWIYAIAAYGFLLGVGLGWLPAAITATIAAFVWPLIALAIVVIIGMIFLA